MARLKTLARVLAGAVGFFVYVWFAGVRLAPRVKRRKAARRARRTARPAPPPE